MAKKILYLPDELKFAAICNQIEQGNKPNDGHDIGEIASRGNFDWDDTMQKSIFWRDVDDSFWAITKGDQSIKLIYKD